MVWTQARTFTAISASNASRVTSSRGSIRTTPAQLTSRVTVRPRSAHARASPVSAGSARFTARNSPRDGSSGSMRSSIRIE